MREKIGKTAGEVWKYLNEHDEVTPTELIRELDGTARLICMAIGWLAREDKIKFRKEERASYISLKKD